MSPVVLSHAVGTRRALSRRRCDSRFYRQAARGRRSILIAEDDADLSEMLSDLLTHEGYDVISAANGVEALHYLRMADRHPCIILLDLMMPIMTGWEVLDALAREPDLQRIPVVVLTAALNPRLPAGTRWFAKPPPLPSLLAEIRSACG
jgi:two-component system, OmpR family, response regulator CpxR